MKKALLYLFYIVSTPYVLLVIAIYIIGSLFYDVGRNILNLIDFLTPPYEYIVDKLKQKGAK